MVFGVRDLVGQRVPAGFADEDLAQADRHSVAGVLAEEDVGHNDGHDKGNGHHQHGGTEQNT